jgi:hypothetical protein
VGTAWRRSGRERGLGHSRVGATRNDAADRWAGTRQGLGRQRLRAAQGSAVRWVSAALTRGAGSTVRPIRFSNRIKFISNGFKFAPNFDQ